MSPVVAQLRPVAMSALESALEATADPVVGASGGAGLGDSQRGLERCKPVAPSSLRRVILCRTVDIAGACKVGKRLVPTRLLQFASAPEGVISGAFFDPKLLHAERYCCCRRIACTDLIENVFAHVFMRRLFGF